MKNISLLLFILIHSIMNAQSSVQFAVLKYNGGGDYYANPTSVPNLVKFCNENLQMNVKKDVPFIEAGNKDIINFPFIHMTGHGNVVFSLSEAENLRNYCFGGGFLHIDDNYGMDKFIREEIKKVFPNNPLTLVPNNHEIFTSKYKFSGLPKIHEHDNKTAQAYAIFHEGKIVCFYTTETDLGDGWEDKEVHNNPEEKRLEALKMGANIITYAFMR